MVFRPGATVGVGDGDAVAVGSAEGSVDADGDGEGLVVSPGAIVAGGVTVETATSLGDAPGPLPLPPRTRKASATPPTTAITNTRATARRCGMVIGAW
jgi:hypothetical protein